jgi:hypothetical protein
MKLQELVPNSLQNKYGKVFMGQSSLFQKMQKAEYERNTDAEKELIMALNKWVNMTSKISSEYLQEFEDDLMKIVKVNPWLCPPAGSDVCRFTLISLINKNGAKSKYNEDFLNSIIDEFASNSENRKLQNFKSSIKYTYSPRRPLQSWSLGVAGAALYKSKWESHSSLNGVHAILQSKVTDNSFIFTPKTLYDLLGDEATLSIKAENETIRFSNDPIQCNAIFNTKELIKYIQFKKNK